MDYYIIPYAYDSQYHIYRPHDIITYYHDSMRDAKRQSWWENY